MNDVNADSMRTLAAESRLKGVLADILERAEIGENFIHFPEPLADHVASALRDRGFVVTNSYGATSVKWEEPK